MVCLHPVIFFDQVRQLQMGRPDARVNGRSAALRGHAERFDDPLLAVGAAASAAGRRCPSKLSLTIKDATAQLFLKKD
jgi:hypothetical protein